MDLKKILTEKEIHEVMGSCGLVWKGGNSWYSEDHEREAEMEWHIGGRTLGALIKTIAKFYGNMEYAIGKRHGKEVQQELIKIKWKEFMGEVT